MPYHSNAMNAADPKMRSLRANQRHWQHGKARRAPMKLWLCLLTYLACSIRLAAAGIPGGASSSKCEGRVTAVDCYIDQNTGLVRGFKLQTTVGPNALCDVGGSPASSLALNTPESIIRVTACGVKESTSGYGSVTFETDMGRTWTCGKASYKGICNTMTAPEPPKATTVKTPAARLIQKSADKLLAFIFAGQLPSKHKQMQDRVEQVLPGKDSTHIYYKDFETYKQQARDCRAACQNCKPKCPYTPLYYYGYVFPLATVSGQCHNATNNLQKILDTCWTQGYVPEPPAPPAVKVQAAVTVTMAKGVRCPTDNTQVSYIMSYANAAIMAANPELAGMNTTVNDWACQSEGNTLSATVSITIPTGMTTTDFAQALTGTIGAPGSNICVTLKGSCASEVSTMTWHFEAPASASETGSRGLKSAGEMSDRVAEAQFLKELLYGG